MVYENELRFLCDTFQKSRLKALTLTPSDLLKPELSSSGLAYEGDAFLPPIGSLPRFWEEIEPRTVYKFTDSYRRAYLYLQLPEIPQTTLLVIGPYLGAPILPEQIPEIAEQNGISPKSQRYLDECYASLPVLEEASPLFLMLDAFCEYIWKSPSFAVVDVNLDTPQPASLINDTGKEDFNDILLNMKAMEKRYELENEIMQAVALGQIHKEKRLLNAFSDNAFEKRTADPLRNAKNYCIIMNTLLRKAAETGGVHPMYLDRISSAFAREIEQLPLLSEVPELMRQMFCAYCRLVRKHSMKTYSLLVQKIILIIDSDLSAGLSLGALAQSQNISAGYLSTVFKKETGKTISEYIREKRINHAIHLLGTTHLQIQTVALHCGIMDVQYFSKLFKKQTNMTPKEYRDSIKRGYK